MVLTFIIVGAVLRQINLLILLAGLMLGPLLLNWRIVAATLRRMSVRRKFPDHATAGSPFLIEVVATNDRPRLGSWAIAVQDNITLVNATPQVHRTKVEVLIPHVGPLDSSRTNYRCVLKRRGLYRFGSLRISTRFPLGLLRGSLTSQQETEFIVWPRIGRLTQRWTRVVESGTFGDRHSMHRQGFVENGEYYGVREWRPGDSRRWIHWRTSAKLGDLAVREFEQQRNRDLAIFLDLWQPNEPTPEDLNHVEVAVGFVATIVAESCRQGGKNLSVALAGDVKRIRSGSSSNMLMRELLDDVALIGATRDNGLNQLLSELLDEVSAGARLITISTRAAGAVELDLSDAEPWKDAALKKMTWFNVSRNEHSHLFQWRDE